MAEAIRSDFAPSLGDLFGEDCLDFFLNMRSGCTTTVWSFLWMLFLGDCLPPPKMVIGCRILQMMSRILSTAFLDSLLIVTAVSFFSTAAIVSSVRLSSCVRRDYWRRAKWHLSRGRLAIAT